MGEDRKFRYDMVDGQFVNRVSGEPIPPEEPVILFRARDKHALELLRKYQDLVQDPGHKMAVQDRIDEFRNFRLAYPERMKEPGVTGDILLNRDKHD